MILLNKQTLNNKKYTVFITSYCGIEYFLQWENVIDKKNIQIVIIDSGKQSAVRQITEYPILQTSMNVGAAGAWNIATYFAFMQMGIDKILIGQDDAVFNEDMLRHVWDESTDSVFAGAYDTGFTFSLFGLTKNLWNEVGIFDENFIYATYEDNDYIHRLRLSNKEIKCLNYSSNLNRSIASSKMDKAIVSKNKLFMEEKWGHFEGVYKHPFNNSTLKISDCVIHPHLIETHGYIEDFPSVLEFEKFVNADN